MTTDLTFPVDPWLLLAAVVVGTLGAARLTRLIVHDSFPPAAWARSVWDGWTKDGSWAVLAHCHWCLGPWMTLLALATAFIGPLHVVWWLFWGWLAASYLTSMIVERDEVPHDHDH